MSSWLALKISKMTPGGQILNLIVSATLIQLGKSTDSELLTYKAHTGTWPPLPFRMKRMCEVKEKETLQHTSRNISISSTNLGSLDQLVPWSSVSTVLELKIRGLTGCVSAAHAFCSKRFWFGSPMTLELRRSCHGWICMLVGPPGIIRLYQLVSKTSFAACQLKSKPPHLFKFLLKPWHQEIGYIFDVRPNHRCNARIWCQ